MIRLKRPIYKTLLALVAIVAVNYSGAAFAVGTWTTVNDATIEQGGTVYVRGVGYYADNTVVVTAPVAGDVRLIVASSTHVVDNADGTDESGYPYFTLSSVSDTTRIYFQYARARLNYTAQLQEFVEEVDDVDEDGIPDDIDTCPLDPENDVDGDGICAEEDLCPTDVTNSCVTITGQVFGGGASLAGSSVKVGASSNTVSTVSDAAGFFTIDVGQLELSNDNVGAFFPVEVKSTGFSTGNLKVVLVEGRFEYDVTVNLQQVSDTIATDDDLNAGVELVKGGQPIGSLMIPDAALPPGVTEVSGSITYLDPATDDILSTPGGDLLALPASADPNATPVALETYGMMEFDLVDQDGNQIHQLNGPAEVCMKAPVGLGAGDIVPLWYYDEDAGLWREEGEGTVVLRGGDLQICGAVEHFTWWNYDQPITTHSCFHFSIIDEASQQELTDFNWSAEGVTYSGSSPNRSCTNSIPESFNSLTVKVSTDVNNPEQIRVYSLISGSRFYLLSDGDGTYTLTTSQQDATVFDTPTVNGSCLSGTLTGQCMPLDYNDDGDGILPLSTDIDLPPVISFFTLDDYNLLLNESAGALATVTDPDGGDVSVSWDTQCSYGSSSANDESITPISDSGVSGSTFGATFTAPSSLSYVFESCRISVTATDTAGGTTTADRWLTVSGGFDYEISGIVYGTDGQPLVNAEIRYLNRCTSTPLELATQTDNEGAYNLIVDLGACQFPGGGGYIDLGELEVAYTYSSANWTRRMYLDQFSEFGQGQCSVDTLGNNRCEFDVHLPAVWGSISGSVYMSELADQLWSYSHYGFYGGAYGEDEREDFVFSVQSVQSYGPVALPLGSGNLSLLRETTPGSGSYGFVGATSIQVLSTDPELQDFADSFAVTAPMTITVFDDAGFSTPDLLLDIDIYSYFSLDSFSESGVTDASGALVVDTPLGRGGVFYSGGAADFTVRVGDQPLFLDINSPDECLVTGTAYDEFGQPFGNTQFQVQSYSGSSSAGVIDVVTDSVGGFSVLVPPGSFYASFDFFSGGDNVINHCRSVGGLPRAIRRDFQLNDFGFFSDSQG